MTSDDSMRLWSWHPANFELLDTVIDWRRSSFYRYHSYTLSILYPLVHKRIGTDQLIWCYTRPLRMPLFRSTGTAVWQFDVNRTDVTLIKSCEWDAAVADSAVAERRSMADLLADPLRPVEETQAVITRDVARLAREKGRVKVGRTSKSGVSVTPDYVLRHSH